MKSTLKRNLTIGFSISLLILLLSAAAAIISINLLDDSSKMVEHTNVVLQKVEQTLSVMKDAETGQRGFLLSGQDEFLEAYNGTDVEARKLTAEIKSLTADNPTQQRNVDHLSAYVNTRLSKLKDLIKKRKDSNIVDVSDLREGKVFMDSVRAISERMSKEELRLLDLRTKSQNKFAALTPIMIGIASIFAIIITILFYIKVKNDIDQRAKLEAELIQKDIEIGERINVIQHVSERISEGDYTIRVKENQADNLGSISNALNKMTDSLQVSFNTLADKEWLQSGIAGLNEVIIGDENLESVSNKIINFLAEYTGSLVGAFYLQESDTVLNLENGYALKKTASQQKISTGEGLVGQCARNKKLLVVEDINAADINVSFATADVKPANIVVFPLTFEREIKGVIELGSIRKYADREIEFLKSIAENIGIAINTVQSRQRLQELLEETQSQSEELMAQQSELEQINSELEAQAQQLQTSEEELKVQSEELIETNTLLEERSSLLEQRNQVINQKNKEIEKRAEELALSTKYKSEFLANMSHELRTPLNSILLLSRLMSENTDKNLTPDQVQYANVIQSSGNGLLQLIDEILDLSKIEAGKMTIEYLPVHVASIVQDMNLLFAPLADQAKLEWKVNVGAEVPGEIETDKMRLEQVLKNLLSNAFKFTSEGLIHLTIACPEDRPGFICFTVKDTGIGISDEKQELIFEAFQQEDGSTRRKFGGTGLGLSISRELAKLLGGEITVTSTVGKGSEFVCCVPIHQMNVGKLPQKIDAPEILPMREEPTAVFDQSDNGFDPKYNTNIIPADIEDDRDNISTQDKVILIIEDDISFAKALLDYARGKGYKAVVSVRGDKGIEMADKFHPVGILLDVQLPVKNGWEVIESLKKNSRTRHIPVHMMSSFEVKKESIMKGAVDFINKPVAFEQLNTIFDKIEYILAKKEKKVLIIEENYKHAKALAYYLGTYSVNTEIFQSVEESISSLHRKDVDCVILDMSVTDNNSDQLMEKIRSNEGLEDLPIILFTGKSLSQPEEFKIKKYADAIVLKTANSYQRILDEVSLFLHLVQEQHNKKNDPNFEKTVMQENVLKGKTVLLADDDVRNIFSMTKTLEKYQMKVIPAMDGKEALQLLQKGNIDVVLMDMMMPGMDGYESTRNIRKIPAYRNLPIIAVTAKAMSGDREKCIAAGASDYISKPVDLDQLVSLLRIWLYEKGY